MAASNLYAREFPRYAAPLLLLLLSLSSTFWQTIARQDLNAYLRTVELIPATASMNRCGRASIPSHFANDTRE